MTILFFVTVTIVILSILAASFTEKHQRNVERQSDDSLSATAEEASLQTAIESDQVGIMQQSAPIEIVSAEEEKTVGERVQEVLKSQGIPFEIDEDGDVCFEYRFHRFVLNKSQSTNGFFLDMGFNENLDEQRRMMLLKAANFLHGTYRLIKMTVYESAFVFSVDSIISHDTDYKHLLRISLDLLEEAYNELGKIISRQEKEQNKQVSTIGFYQALEEMQQEKGENKLEVQPLEETEHLQSQPPSIGFNSPKYKS